MRWFKFLTGKFVAAGTRIVVPGHIVLLYRLKLPLSSLPALRKSVRIISHEHVRGRRKKKLEVSQPIDRNKVLTVRSHPFDEANTITFVTSGVNHIRGWALKENQLKGHSWTGECR
jgi:hypothetical protein